MFPFHRKHATSPVPARTTLSTQRGCSRRNDKDGDASTSTTDYHHESHHRLPLHEPFDYNTTCSKSYPKQHVQKALREREDAIMTAVKNSPTYEKNDNRVRLGPNKLNTFQCLKDNRSTKIKNESDLNNQLLIDTGSANKRETNTKVSLKIDSDCDRMPSILTSNNSKNNNNSEPISENNNVVSDENRINNEQINLSPTECTSDPIEPEQMNTNEEENVGDNNCDKNLCETNTPNSDDNSLETNLEKIKLNQSDSPPESINSKIIIEDNSETLANNSVPDDIEKEKCTLLKKEKLKEFLNKSNCCIEDCISSDKYVIVRQDLINILKKVLFGSEDSSIPKQWIGQSFVFSKNKLKYGLVQNMSGPCGVLAVVQAFILKALLFEPETATVCPEPFRPTTNELKKSLIYALSEILWQAGNKTQAVFVRYAEPEETDNKSFDKLTCQKFTTLVGLRTTIGDNIIQLSNPNNNGCFLFVISILLSTGIKNVLADMDEETYSLIGQNGFCSLELVTLLLTGHAVSNVFDNTLHLGSYLLQGVSKRSDIGFLSIYEHFSTFQVGSNLKTPKYPIWIVNSENHFTVVFSENMKLVSDWRAERQFNVYHYDNMQSYTSEVKLTIDTTGLYLKQRAEGEYIPPLELCLRTKWKDAAIGWNGTMPY